MGRNHVKLGQAQTWFTQGLGLGHRGGIWTPVVLDVTMYLWLCDLQYMYLTTH